MTIKDKTRAELKLCCSSIIKRIIPAFAWLNWSQNTLITTKSRNKPSISHINIWNTVKTTYKFRGIAMPPCRYLDRSWEFQQVETPRILTQSAHELLSALRSGRLYTPGKIPGTHFWPHGHRNFLKFLLLFSLYFIRPCFFVWIVLASTFCLYYTTQTSMPWWDSNPQSQQAIGRRPSP